MLLTALVMGAKGMLLHVADLTHSLLRVRVTFCSVLLSGRSSFISRRDTQVVLSVTNIFDKVIYSVRHNTYTVIKKFMY
jgi:hypothetical protein